MTLPSGVKMLPRRELRNIVQWLVPQVPAGTLACRIATPAFFISRPAAMKSSQVTSWPGLRPNRSKTSRLYTTQPGRTSGIPPQILPPYSACIQAVGRTSFLYGAIRSVRSTIPPRSPYLENIRRTTSLTSGAPLPLASDA